MIRLRTSLLLLAAAVLLLTGSPLFAAAGDSEAPPLAWLDAAPCAGATSTPAISTPAPKLDLIIPPNDYIQCSCKFCRENPYVECQISPSGYSILCEDYSRLHNC